MNSTFVVALLFTFSWISVSVSEFHTVDAQSGEDISLLCTNYSKTPGYLFWFRLDNRPNATCISSISSSDSNVSFCDGFQNGKFNMTSNMTTVFLHIKQVDLSDSALYFCGFRWEHKTTIVSATYLKVQEKMSVDLPALIIVVLGALVVFLIIVVISLVMKKRQFYADLKKEEEATQQSENPGSHDLNYARLSFKRNKMPAPKRGMEQMVVYTATR